MGLSSIEMVIKAPEAVIRQFLVVLLFLRGPGHNGVLGDCSALEVSWVVQRVQINVHGLRDVIIFLVLHKDHKELILTTYEPSELNMVLWKPMNPQKLNDILNLHDDQDPSEWLTNLLHHLYHSKLQFGVFWTLDYHLNTTGTHQNPTSPFSSIENTLGTLTLPYKDFITYSKDDFLFRKMLVFNFRFFLLNVLIWSIFMIGIKIRTVLNLELNGLHENVQNFNSRCPGSREIAKT